MGVRKKSEDKNKERSENTVNKKRSRFNKGGVTKI